MLNTPTIDPIQLALNTAKKTKPAVPSTPAPLQSLLKPKTQQLQAPTSNIAGGIPGIGLSAVNNPLQTGTKYVNKPTPKVINNTLPQQLPKTDSYDLGELSEKEIKFMKAVKDQGGSLDDALGFIKQKRAESQTTGFERLVNKVIGDKTPLQALVTPTVRFARGIADVGAGIQEGIDTGLSKIGLMPSQEAKNKQARAKDEAITQRILGNKGASESVIQELGKIAGSFIANAPTGKLGTAGKMALGATEGLLGGASYNLSTGEGVGSPVNLGLSTALGAVIPGVGALAKGVAKKTPALKNKLAKTLLNSGIKITDTNKKAIVKATGKDWTDLALENDIVGSIDDMITKTDEMVDNAMQQKLTTLQSIKETTPVTQTEKLIANSVISQAKRDIEELYGKAFDQITDVEKVPELQDVFNIVNNLQKTMDLGAITPAQKEALKSLYDAYNSHLKYDPAKNRILSGAEKIRLSLQEQIEEIGNKVGVDIKGLNKKIAGGYALKKGLIQAGNRMDNLNMFGLSDSQTAILSAALGGTPLQVVGTIIGKGILESIPVKSKIAKSLYTKGLNELTSNIPINRPTARGNISSQFASSNPPSIGGKADDVKFPIKLMQEGTQSKGATLPKPQPKVPPIIRETGAIGQPYKVPPKTPNKPVAPKINNSKSKVDTFKRMVELDSDKGFKKIGMAQPLQKYKLESGLYESPIGKIENQVQDGMTTKYRVNGKLYNYSDLGGIREKLDADTIKNTQITSNALSELSKIARGNGSVYKSNLRYVLDDLGIKSVYDIPEGTEVDILKMVKAKKAPNIKKGK